MSGTEIINFGSLLQLLARFGFNTIILLVLIRFLYYPTTRRKEYLFTYILIGTTVFLLCFMLESVKLELGFALGLFAIFGIIKYRTDLMPIKEMTYLFVVIGISVINALTTSSISYAELLLANLLVLLITYGLERIWLLKDEIGKIIVYGNLEMVKPCHLSELKKDIQERTGLDINKIKIGDIDFIKNRVAITIFYYENSNKIDQATHVYADVDSATRTAS